MKVFEFHFNPPKQGKEKNNLIFESFCYEPENFYEKKLGGLYLVGLVKNVLPQNARLLDNLAKTIRDRYYKLTSAGPEKSLRESLKRANEFLEKVSKSGDVSWLGNLSFSATAIAPDQRGGAELNFTKVGELKFFLLRGGHITDIDRNLKFEEIEPFPLKIFGNIVSGKLIENDLLVISTKEVADLFQSQNLLYEIGNLAPFDYRGFKEILSRKKDGFAKISGICLLISCTKETALKEKETLIDKKPLKIFSLKEALAPFFNFFHPFPTNKKTQPAKGKSKTEETKRITLPSLPKLNFSLPVFSFNKNRLFKNILLILTLVLFLIAGFFIFKNQEAQQLKAYQSQLEQVRQKVDEAGSYLIIAENNPQAEKKANILLKEAWEEIAPLSKISHTLPAEFSSQVTDLKKTISDSLFKLNKMQVMEDIQPIFEFKARDFVPQKIVFFKENLYFYNPYGENVFELKPSQTSESKIINSPKKFDLAFSTNDSILFFAKPDQLIKFQDGGFKDAISLEIPYPNFFFNDFSAYFSNLYFLDKKNGEIVKYPFIRDNKWGPPQLWLNQKFKKASEAKSIAANGSVWILTKNNSIEKYYSGNLQQTIALNIFPAVQDLSQVLTNDQTSYLYLLDHTERRIIVIDKSGRLIKQFKSEKFDNILDFTISDNGKTIYILNGLKAYKIDI